jgi:hypothetical protein
MRANSETGGGAENAAQSRAFFEFCVGCNYLFTGVFILDG